MCNEYITGYLGVIDIAYKVEENRLKWLGHVVRRKQEHITRVVRAQTLEGKAKRGRLKIKRT